MPTRRRPDSAAVFLNVPYDAAYEPLFIALVLALVSIGRKVHCVLEIPERGQGRLTRIMKQMEACAVSIHDLSRVGGPARFNMPFELGLAYALRNASPRAHYGFILMEEVAHRLDRTLSDLNGHDPQIHHGRPLEAIDAVLNALGTGAGTPLPNDVYRVWRRLMKASRKLKAATRAKTIFTPSLFRRLTAAAAELALRAGFISS